MSNYIYLDENKKGSLAISTDVICDLAKNSISKLDFFATSKKDLDKTHTFSLTKPISATIKNGIIHIKVYIDVTKDSDISKLCKKIIDEASNKIRFALGYQPFDVQVQVESLN